MGGKRYRNLTVQGSLHGDRRCEAGGTVLLEPGTAERTAGSSTGGRREVNSAHL